MDMHEKEFNTIVSKSLDEGGDFFLKSKLLEGLENCTYESFLSKHKIYETYEDARSDAKRNGLKLEAHHILPVAYQKNVLGLNQKSIDWNDTCVLLSRKDHFIAHYLLSRDKGGYFTSIFLGIISFLKNSPLEVFLSEEYDEERRKFLSEKQKNNWKNPEYRESLLKSFNSPHCKELQSKNNCMHRQEIRDKVSGDLNCMNNPEIRKKHLEICTSEEHKRKLSEIKRAHPERNPMNNPFYQEKHHKIMALRGLVYQEAKKHYSDVTWSNFGEGYRNHKYDDIKFRVLEDHEELRI